MDLDFLNGIGEKAREAAVYASEKAKSAAEIAKVNVLVANEQHNMDKNYKAIGEWFVSEYQGEYPDAIKDLAAAIAASKAKIADLQGSLKQESEAPCAEKKVCPVCGTATDGKFCPSCGAAMGE